MNYEYKVINVDSTKAFIKRAILYVAILLITISLALIVLFILFERYLSLLIPGGLILLSAATVFLLGRRASTFEYSYTNKALRVTGGRKEVCFDLSKLQIIKSAENSEFSIKNIIKLSFIKNKIVFKTAINDNNFSVKNYTFIYDNQKYIAAFDDYALALIEGAKDEN